MSARLHDTRIEAPSLGRGDPARQSLRRDVNERITLAGEELGATAEDTLDVLCECVHADCAGLISITVAEYQAVRRFPTRFFVKAGHEVAKTERVVAESDGHVVIEATGQTGLRAVVTDPRSQHHRRPQSRVEP